jgi:hypothetical protein
MWRSIRGLRLKHKMSRRFVATGCPVPLAYSTSIYTPPTQIFCVPHVKIAFKTLSLTSARGHAGRFSLTQLRGTRGPTGSTNCGTTGSTNCGTFFLPGHRLPRTRTLYCDATGCPVRQYDSGRGRVSFGSINPSFAEFVSCKYDTSLSKITSSGAP